MPQGYLQIAIFFVVLVALMPVLGGYMARVYTGQTVLLERVLGPFERLLYRVLRRERQRRPGLEALRALGDRVLAAGVAGDVRDPAHADDPPLEQLPGRDVPLRHVGRHVQHGLVVRDEHQLAVLRRRDDADLLQPDDRDDGRELPVRRRRDRGLDRDDPRDHRPQRQEPRQLLAGPGAHAALRAAAAGGDRHAAVGLPGRDPGHRPLHHRAHGRGRHTDARPGPGRLADRDQAARHQRRRLLQHKLRVPVRERDRRSRTSSRCCSSS